MANLDLGGELAGGGESFGEITDLFTDCCHALFWQNLGSLPFSAAMDLWLEVSISEESQAINKFTDNPRLTAVGRLTLAILQ